MKPSPIQHDRTAHSILRVTTPDDGWFTAARERTSPQRLRRRSAPSNGVAGRGGPGLAPLAVSQHQLWYLSQLAPDSVACNRVVTVRKTERLDTDALRRAFAEIVRRHQAWRTSYPVVDGEPQQLVHTPVPFELPLLDRAKLSFSEAERRAAEVVAADAQRRYDVSTGPPLCPRLVRITADDHRLYIGLHPLVSDWVTLHRLLLRELVTLYDDYAAGRPSLLAEPQLQYRDYAAWEVDWVSGSAVARRVQHWRNRLAGSTPLGLPLDHPRPPRQQLRAGTVALAIDRDTAERLRGVGEELGATLVEVLAAAYAWWLHRYTGSTDVVFAIPG